MRIHNMVPLLILSLVLIGIGVLSIPVYRILLHRYAPRQYRKLRDAGRFASMPASWDELWRVWTEPQSEFMIEISRSAGLEDPRVFYGRFVDRYLMPVPFLRMICTFAGIIGLVLLMIYFGISAFR